MVSTAGETRGTSLRQFLQFHRAQIAPQTRGFKPPTGPGRRADSEGLSQAQVATLLGWSSPMYARLEREATEPTDAQLQEIADALSLDSSQRSDLWAIAVRRDPPAQPSLAAQPRPHDIWTDLVLSVDGPAGVIAYITDAAWNLVTHNDAYADMFPNRQPPTNIVEWMLWDGANQLPEHESAWRLPVLSQLDIALARYPGDQQLQALMQRVQADPDVGPLFEEHRHLGYVHPDGDVRPFIHAGQKTRGSLEIGAATPLGASGSRLILMLFVPNMAPDELRKHRGWRV